MHRSRTFLRRRLVGVVLASFAALAMLAQPAAAAAGHVSLQRPFDLTGDRNVLRQDMRVNDTSPFGGVGTSFILGPDEERGTSFSVHLQQGGRSMASRQLNLWGWGKFKNVSSPGNVCQLEVISDGNGVLSCIYEAFDWLTGNTYRVQMMRGDQLANPVAKNANGYYWIVQIYRFNSRTRRWVEGQKIVSFRAPQGLLAPLQHGPFAFVNPDECAAIDTLAATFGKPFGAGSTTQWNRVAKYVYGCGDATTSITNHRNGAVSLGISS